MKAIARISTLVLAISMPLSALAAPANVTGIKAELSDGGVKVSWNPVGGDIATYRVFYSQASILNNNGLYDDFETEAGTSTSHILRSLPAVQDLYVSVLALDSKGKESPYFLEEAHVTLNAAPAMPSSAMQQSSVPTPMPTPTPTPLPTSMPTSVPTSAPAADILRLLRAEVMSSTGITLHFSLPVTVDANRALDAVTIETASGTKLNMMRFVIQGNDLMVHTDIQERGVAYKVTISNAVTAAGAAGQRLAVQPGENSLFVVGHGTGRDPSTGPSSSGTSTGPIVKSDVTQLRLRAQPTGNTYRVDVTWQATSLASDVAGFTGYSVAQTTDDGKTYGPAQTIAKSATTITVKNVPAGSFGVVIRTIYSDGSQSKGIMQIIKLATIGGVAGSVTGGSTTLPNSGPALWLAVLAAGSTAYILQKRRHRDAEAVA